MKDLVDMSAKRDFFAAFQKPGIGKSSSKTKTIHSQFRSSLPLFSVQIAVGNYERGCIMIS